MYQVDWRRTAFDQVANAWLAADAALRGEISAVVRRIGSELSMEPETKGESRSTERRILLLAPLGVIFRVDSDLQTVIVLRAWVFKRSRT